MNIRLNNKGAFNIHIAISVLMVCLVVISLFYTSLISKSMSTNDILKSVEPYIVAKNGLERLYGKFYENISYNEFTSYDDIERTYELVEKDLINRIVNIGPVYEGTYTFSIFNKTDVIINLNFSSYPDLEPEESSYYNVSLLYQGNTIFSSSESGSKTVIIPASHFYDEIIGSTNYGEYTLITIGINGSLNTNISYNEQAYRRLEIIENNEKKRTLVLENNMSIDGTMKRYFIKSE